MSERRFALIDFTYGAVKAGRLCLCEYIYSLPQAVAHAATSIAPLVINHQSNTCGRVGIQTNVYG
jgi:hypothetical protein